MEEDKKEVDSATGTTSASDTSAETQPEVKEEKSARKARRTKPLNKKLIAVLTLLVILAVGYSIYKGNPDRFYKALNSVGLKVQNPNPTMTAKEAEDFINANFMQGGTGATVTEVTTESGLFKIKLTVAGSEYTAYLTKDKKVFFPQAIDVAQLQKDKAATDTQSQDDETKAKAEQEAALANMPKSDKPVVELFVMSHCPYGTQIEKGILPVLKTLNGKVDFKLKFCDYAMHGEEELNEEMNQYCIQQDQPDKLVPYLECFLADKAASAKCAAQVGIDSGKLAACVKATDTQYKISASFQDKSTYKGNYPIFPIYQADVTKYKVEGSPNLVVNGTLLPSVSRDPASLLKTVCSGFSAAPGECSQTLDSTVPAAGFGTGAAESGAGSNASCGS